LSLLSGATSGAHPGYAPYFIRRVRMSSDAELVEVCRKSGYKVEYVRNFDGSEDHNTVVIEFPCKLPEHAIVAKDCTAIDQLNIIKRLQQEWSDNAVSVTIYYKKEELDEIKKWLKENYNKNLKTVSFLLHNEHGFDQAPLEEITEIEYNKLNTLQKEITSIEIDETSIDASQIGCETGMCPIK
jgi:hypothetical protein